MSNKNFGQFTQESSPTTAQFVVGYNTAVSGGERRFALSDVLGLFRTQVFSTANGILQADGAGNVTSTGLTYSGSTLSVPAGFVVSGAGSLALIAGGTNRNVTITPSGMGNIEMLLNTATASSFPTGQGLRITGPNAINTTLFIDSFGAAPQIVMRRSGGTLSSPSALSSGNSIVNFSARGYGVTGYSSGARSAMALSAASNWTDTSQTTRFSVSIVPIQALDNTTLVEGFGIGVGGGTASSFATFNKDGAAIARAGFSTTGVGLSFRATTATDTSSSGTVASAVMHDFGIPTFAASSATTFTNAANVYIAGDVANGTNVTLTNSYGLWNVGKTRLDGAIAIGGAAISTSTALITPAGTTGVSSLRIPHGAAPTSPVNGDMWTTTAGLFIRINGATVGPLT